MIERVLVPLDGSPLGERILPYVRGMLCRDDSDIILVHAAVPPSIENAVSIADALLASGQGYLEGVQERLAKDGVRVKTVCRVGSAAAVILKVAGEEKATMLALATHGHSGLKRRLLGSVAETLMRRSSVPVFVVRPFWSYEVLPGSLAKQDLPPIRHILLPVAGDDLALALLPSLIACARLFESRVLLLHVRATAKKETGDSQEDQRGLETIVECTRRLEEQGVATLSLMEMGDPAHVILKVARSQHIDLIAMATHGRAGIDRLFKGSVTEKVLHESPCPMLVVGVLGPVRGKNQPDAVRKLQT